ncbi:MAG TPA: isochorismatase family cysteine hydrolase [Acidimicrobiia bacterium]
MSGGHLDPPIDVDAAALLVMDYQAGILGRLGDREEAQIERAAAALDIARSAGMRVGYVRVAFEAADVAAVPPTNANFAAAAASLPADAPHTQVHERLAPRAGDIVVRKTRVGAFSTTDLDAQLRKAGVDTILLAGISTSGVVLSTVATALIAITASWCSPTAAPTSMPKCTRCSLPACSRARRK